MPKMPKKELSADDRFVAAIDLGALLYLPLSNGTCVIIRAEQIDRIEILDVSEKGHELGVVLKSQKVLKLRTCEDWQYYLEEWAQQRNRWSQMWRGK